MEQKKPALKREKEVSKLYSERLVKKLEKKMLDLESDITERKRAERAVQGDKEYADSGDCSRIPCDMDADRIKRGNLQLHAWLLEAVLMPRALVAEVARHET